MPPVHNKLIHHFLEQSSILFPDKCAMVHGESRASYTTLNRDANQVAHWLIDQRTDPGDRVVLLLENCREYLAGYYGSLKAGCVVVPLNPDLKPDGLANILEEIRPRVIISSTKCERTLQQLDLTRFSVAAILIARSKLPWTKASLSISEFGDFGPSSADINPSLNIDESSLASIIFTSGSTGKPKGVMLSHGNIVANTRSIVSYLELASTDIQMVVLPFFYVMGKSLLNTHVAVGGTVVINNTFAYPASVVQQLIDEGVTGFSGVPSTYAYLLHRSPLREARESLTSLRYCSQAGGHMARHIKEELLNVLPSHTKLYVMYGATEAAARLTYVEPYRLREKIDSIGIPIPDVTMSVLDDNGRELANGETGELVANGPNIMSGYWKDPIATGMALSNHGYHTGDLGFRDKDGYFYVVGRKDNQLKVGGHRVNPQEVEDAIIATDLVIEAAVLGIHDPLAGHRLVAFAVPVSEGTIDRDILLRCSKVLPRHKLPSELRLVKTLPKNSSGKVDREGCIKLYLGP